MKTLLLALGLLSSSLTYADDVVLGKRCDVDLTFSSSGELNVSNFSKRATLDAKRAIEKLGYKIVPVSPDSSSYGKTEFILHFGAQDYGLSSYIQVYMIRALDEQGRITRDDIKFRNGNHRLEDSGNRNRLLKAAVKLVPECVISK